MGCTCSKDKPKEPKGRKSAVSPKAEPEAPKPVAATPAAEPVHEQADVVAATREAEEPASGEAEEVVDARRQRIGLVNSMRSTTYKYGHPTAEGEAVPCFPEGLLYRITGDDSWHFYNDTLDYEMHINYRFGPESQLRSEVGTVTQDADGWYTVSAVAHPRETIEYFTGRYNGYKSSITAKPLSAAYRSSANKEAYQKAARARQEVLGLFGTTAEESEVLKQCIDLGLQYVDINFPPTQDSLFRPGVDGRVIPETAWMRPAEYLSGADHEVKVFSGAVVPQVIDEGSLGDQWFTGAVAVLSESEPRITAMFAEALAGENASARAAGAYYVRLNKSGWWHSILVDDYLPTISKVPCYARSTDDPGELWVSLLQKAYAKVHGSYAAITGGDTASALTDLTGFPSYRFDEEWEAAVANEEKTAALVRKLGQYMEKGYIVVANTPGNDFSSYLGKERKADKKAFGARFKKAGLELRSAYAVLSVKSFAEQGLHLVQFRNPRGTGTEWTGAWSGGSDEWETYPEVAKACRGSSTAYPGDGSFWMEWRAVVQHFDGGVVCYAQDPAAAPMEEYRVRGVFEEEVPSVVLEVTATRPVTALLTFAQTDKRGRPHTDPDSEFAALMLSVAHMHPHSNNKYTVHLNSASDPESPTAEFAFAIARETAMVYTFEPRETPYYVIPRLHTKATHHKEYVLAMHLESGAKADLSVAFKKIDGSCKVFSNIATFALEEVADASAVTQFTDAHGHTTATGTAASF